MTTYRNTFLVVLGTIFLLPLFFIPGGALDLNSAKSILLCAGAVVAALVFLYETWQAGEVVLPKSMLIVAMALLPLIYFLSALLSTPSSLSLLGYNFEVGTFAFILLCSVLCVLCSVIFSDTSRALQGILAIFLSLSLVALFAVVKIILPNVLILGNFSGNMGNSIGAWTDLSLAFGLLSILSILILGMFPMKGYFKWLLYIVFAVATVLLSIVNFSTVNIIVLVFSAFLILYFFKLEKGKKNKVNTVRILPIILAVVTLALTLNPFGLGAKISKLTGVSNAEVRPTLSTTLGISKLVLTESGLFGSGPNTFSRDWLLYKPQEVNATPFWAVAFPYGAGFIPTQIAATGFIGTFLWLFFLVLVLGLALKAFANLPTSLAPRFALVTTAITTLLLWMAAFLYVPSAVVLVLAFVSTGIFVAMCCQAGILTLKTFDLKDSTNKATGCAIFAGITLGAVILLFTGVEKALAQYHFKIAADMASRGGADLLQVERRVEKAIKFAPLDNYFLALAQVNFAKAQAAANAPTTSSRQAQENRAVFQEALTKSVQAAKAAVASNPGNYTNWVALGNIYSVLVPPPLFVQGAYENARLAYNEAYKRNPTNPELPLLLAYLEIARNNLTDARSYIMSSLALKEDFVEARKLLEQLNAFEKANGK